MRRIPRIAVLVIVLGVGSSSVLFSQTYHSHMPGVRPMLQGGQGVLGLGDASALFWNPAGLAPYRGQQGYLSLAESFSIEYAGAAAFFPEIGTVAAAIGRLPAPGHDQLLSAGLGRSFIGRIHTGISLTNHPDGRTSYTALGIGAIWQPLDLVKLREGSTFPRWLIPFSAGLSFTEISLNPSSGPAYRGSAALCYDITRQGPRISYGYSWQGGQIGRAHV